MNSRNAQLMKAPAYVAARQANDETALRMACFEAWKARHVKYVFVDDAHAMTVVSKHERPSDFVQPWIVAAEEAGVTLIFVGTPAMRLLWDGEGEIRRRSRTVYVRRYRKHNVAERKEFIRIVQTLTAEPNWRDVPRRALWSTLFYASFGVFGELKKLIEDTAFNADARGSESVSISDVESAIPSKSILTAAAVRASEFDVISSPASLEELEEIYQEIIFPVESQLTQRGNA